MYGGELTELASQLSLVIEHSTILLQANQWQYCENSYAKP